MAATHEPKPRFHIAPPKGWINDPNGPLYYKGYYHMFYQYVETGCQWSWGLLWGHAVSRDLITWQHLPPALAPTFGGFDGDGCFSGCATLNEDGVPTILYTGVRLRSSDTCGPLPPPECDLGTACIETQCLAFGDPADPKLTFWTKDDVPFISLPPPNMNLTAWRDPYVIGRPGEDGQDCWTVMVGAGVKERGGTALVYKAPALRGGAWSYAGELCRGQGDTGVIWECPVMLQLPRLPPPPLPLLPLAPSPALAGSPPPLDATRFLPGSPVPDGKLGRMSPAAMQQRQHELMMNIIMPSPASPRPPIKLLPTAAADLPADGVAWATAIDTDAAAAAVEGLGVIWLPPVAAAVGVALSPRRSVPALPQAPLIPLRSPTRWHLPSLHAVPHAPSPPAPRPPSARRPGTPTTGRLSPITGGVEWQQQQRWRRTLTASPRSPQLLHGDAADGHVLTHGSAASPVGPRSPVGAVAALLTGGPAAAAGQTVVPTAGLPEQKLPTGAAASSWPPTPEAASDGAVASSSFSWQRHQTFFCVCPDDCNSMAVYYLGSYDTKGSAFDLSEALGPFPLDLGDIFYAPNTLMDPEGRSVLWGWLQEKPRKVGTYDYAGCLSMPRLLFLEVDEQAAASHQGPGVDGGAKQAVHLVQRPPPEISKLRLPGSEWLAEGLLLEPSSTLPVPLSSGHHLELEVSMLPLPQSGTGAGMAPTPHRAGGPAGTTEATGMTDAVGAGTGAGHAGVGSRCSGVLLHSWRGGAEGAAALLYHWDSGVLEVVFEAMDPVTLAFSLAAPGARRVGGRLLRPPPSGSPLSLRVFLDYSCLEVFTGDGEVLTTRVYRGSAPASQHHHHHHHYDPIGSPPPTYGFGGAAAAGVELVTFGCSTEFTSVGAYEVGSIWLDDV